MSSYHDYVKGEENRTAWAPRSVLAGHRLHHCQEEERRLAEVGAVMNLLGRLDAGCQDQAQLANDDDDDDDDDARCWPPGRLDRRTSPDTPRVPRLRTPEPREMRGRTVAVAVDQRPPEYYPTAQALLNRRSYRAAPDHEAKILNRPTP